MANRPINVVIKGDYSDKDIHRAIRDLEKLERQGPKSRDSLRKVGKGFAFAGALAGAAAIAIGVESVQAAAEDEKSTAKLAQTLENLGLAHKNAGVEKMIEDMQFATGVSDSKLRPAFEKLVIATGDVDQASSDLALALDISAGTGKSAEDVALALAKAYGGNEGALKRLGVPLDETAVKTGDMKTIVEDLSKLFEGQAATAADTMAGQVGILKEGVGELSEAFGTGLLNGLGDADGGIDTTSQKLRDMQTDAENLGTFIGGLGSSLLSNIDPFLMGLNAISYGVDIWALDVTSKVNGALDVLGVISDEEGQRRENNEIALRMQTTQDYINQQTAIATGAAPSAIAAPNGQRTNTDGSVTNIYQFGDIQVESSSALTEVQKQAARLASVGGARYAGMAATGDGYRRRKRRGNR